MTLSRTTLLLALLISSAAFAGPRDGGGGGAFTLSRDEIIEEVSHLRNRLALSYHRYEIFLAKAPDIRAEDGKGAAPDKGLLKPVADVIRDGKIQDTIQSVRIVTTDGECHDPNTGEVRAMSILGDTMCVSLKTLSEWPRTSFSNELLALGAHEIAHTRLGKNEILCRVVQEEFLNSDLLHTDWNKLAKALVVIRRDTADAFTAILNNEGKRGAPTATLQMHVRDFVSLLTPRVIQLLDPAMPHAPVSAVTLLEDNSRWMTEVSSKAPELRSKNFAQLYSATRDILGGSKDALVLISDLLQIAPTKMEYEQVDQLENLLRITVLKMADPELKAERVAKRAPEFLKKKRGQYQISDSLTEMEDVTCGLTLPDGTKSQLTFATDETYGDDVRIKSPTFTVKDQNGTDVVMQLEATRPQHPMNVREGIIVTVQPFAPDSTNVLWLNGGMSGQEATTTRYAGQTKLEGQKLVVSGVLERGVMPIFWGTFAVTPSARLSEKDAKSKYGIGCTIPYLSKKPHLPKVPKDWSQILSGEKAEHVLNVLSYPGN